MNINEKRLRDSKGNDPEWAVRWFYNAIETNRSERGRGPVTGIVYFVQGRSRGPIKIGWTNQDMALRLAALQTGSPDPLHVLATHPADRDIERRLHVMFADWRMHGEWFKARAFGLAELVVDINSRLAL